MLTAVVCSGRNRPHCSKGQCDPMASERRSYAPATSRNNNCVPVSSSGAKPSSSRIIRSTRSRDSMILPTVLSARPR